MQMMETKDSANAPLGKTNIVMSLHTFLIVKKNYQLYDNAIKCNKQ